MHTHNQRADRFSARLNLEPLEGRTLLSATLPAAVPAAAVGHQASAAAVLRVNHLPVSHAQAALVDFSYRWGVGPSAVLTGTNSSTGNGKSTGSVAFALVRQGFDAVVPGGAAVAVPVGFVVTTSSARSASPDRFNIDFVLRLRIRDAGSGAWGELTFNGTITGTLTATSSHLTATLQAPTQQLALGKYLYTVTLPKTIHPNGPSSVPTAVYAFVTARAR